MGASNARSRAQSSLPVKIEQGKRSSLAWILSALIPISGLSVLLTVAHTSRQAATAAPGGIYDENNADGVQLLPLESKPLHLAAEIWSSKHAGPPTNVSFSDQMSSLKFPILWAAPFFSQSGKGSFF